MHLASEISLRAQLYQVLLGNSKKKLFQSKYADEHHMHHWMDAYGEGLGNNKDAQVKVNKFSSTK